MLKLKEILKNNNIKMLTISKLLNIDYSTLKSKMNCKHDFKINELEKIKSYLVELNILNENFDIGEFLNIVEE